MWTIIRDISFIKLFYCTLVVWSIDNIWCEHTLNIVFKLRRCSYWFVHTITGSQRSKGTATPLHSQCVQIEVSAEQRGRLTCKLRNTVRRLKKKAMAENPNMRRGFLPIRSITKPWERGQKSNIIGVPGGVQWHCRVITEQCYCSWHCTESVSQSVSPPLWSRRKYLNNSVMNYNDIYPNTGLQSASVSALAKCLVSATT